MTKCAQSTSNACHHLSPVTERQVSYRTVQKPHVSKPATKHISTPKATNSETILIVEASEQQYASLGCFRQVQTDRKSVV